MLNAKELNERLCKESVCNKLRELGAEIIEEYPDKMIFVWCNTICTYVNGTFYGGVKNTLTIENISELNKNGLDCLAGKLTDEQLDRVGNLNDLYEDRINHILSQEEDMKRVGMFGTDMFANLVCQFNELTQLKTQLESTFQSRIMVDYPFSIKQYILFGE